MLRPLFLVHNAYGYAVAENNNHLPDEFSQARALREKLIEGKRERRKRLAALSFSEKIEILEKLRGREHLIAAAGLRKKRGGDDKPTK